MSSDFGGHRDDRGDCSLLEWSGEPTFRDVLDDCSTSTSSYNQVTFANETGVFSGDFAPNAVLMACTRVGQLNDPLN